MMFVVVVVVVHRGDYGIVVLDFRGTATTTTTNDDWLRLDVTAPPLQCLVYG